MPITEAQLPATLANSVSTALINTYKTLRFPVIITNEFPITSQSIKENHLRSIASLGVWTPNNESEAENYIDQCAAVVTRYQIPLNTFIPAIISNQLNSDLTTFEQVSQSGYTDFEDFFDKLIITYFPVSSHLIEMVQSLINPRRFQTVREALGNHKTTMTRYTRCIARWKKNHLISDDLLPISFRLSLPVDLEEHINIQFPKSTSIDEIAIAAAIVEAARNRTRTIHAGVVHPIDNPYVGGPQRKEYTNIPNNCTPYQHRQIHAAPVGYNGPPSPCNGCGENHWRKDCNFRNSRCRNCDDLGHISKVCNARVERDRSHRVISKMKSTKNGNFISTRKDATRLDEAITGGNVLDAIKDRAINANNKRRNRNHERHPPRKPRIEHPVLANKTSSNYYSDDEDDERDDYANKN